MTTVAAYAQGFAQDHFTDFFLQIQYNGIMDQDDWVLVVIAAAGLVLTLVFGVIYRYAFRAEDFNFQTELDTYYFSINTAYNAYGDLRPMTDAAKAVVMLQMTTSWIFIVLLASAIYKGVARFRSVGTSLIKSAMKKTDKLSLSPRFRGARRTLFKLKA